jgi:hypothetical protein
VSKFASMYVKGWVVPVPVEPIGVTYGFNKTSLSLSVCVCTHIYLCTHLYPLLTVAGVNAKLQSHTDELIV